MIPHDVTIEARSLGRGEVHRGACSCGSRGPWRNDVDAAREAVQHLPDELVEGFLEATDLPPAPRANSEAAWQDATHGRA